MLKESNAENAEAAYRQAMLLARDGAHAVEAGAAAREAVELEPENARYVYRLGLILHENLRSFSEAEKAYRRAVDLAPDNPFFYHGLVRLLLEQARLSEALALAAPMRALLLAAENWYGLAALESVLGNVDAALEHLGRAARGNAIDREWARSDPDLERIRDDPRFTEITEEVDDRFRPCG